ncbi:hypothetical protein FB45DRAFT_1054102 [Roridomyces roridus]|uniref:F-box domain-containing protein n=1 Tax=Roridomyces roridus TaxID=1738132 RepID=A0AAD7C7Y1_9AGAR|nr:hypothetical protein FB45DRAFT_1054102 [Roridomyces roridus]
MSVEEPEAGIERVLSEIERQKDSEVLQNLQQNKSTLQRQLNNIRDPIAGLPVEISSEISTLCLPSYLPKQATANQVPTLLLRICNTWSGIALATPALWASFLIRFPCRTGLNVVWERWLQRSGTHPLHIRVLGPLESQAGALIWRHSNRLQRLGILPELQVQGVELDHRDRDILAGTQPQSLPCLRTLSIAGCQRSTFLQLPILRLLRLAPVLTELILYNLLLSHAQEEVETLAGVVLPCLRRLTVARFSNRLGSNDPTQYILDYISAPGLEIFICDSPADYPKLLSFLRRSEASIQDICIREMQNFSGMDELLPLIPSVTRVKFEWNRAQAVEQLFTTLEQRLALPSLRNLQVQWSQCREPPNAFWEAVLRALFDRRTQL